MFTSNQLTNDVAKTSRSRERFEKSSVCSTEQGKSNSVRPSGCTSRPTPQNVGLFAFLRSIHRGLHAPAQSQTLPGAMSLPTQARNGLGAYSAFGTPTLGSLKVARPRISVGGLKKSLELHNPDENWKTKMTSRLCPARQKREFWSLFFITGRSRPETLGRLDFPRPTILLVFLASTMRESRFVSTP